MLDRWFFLCHKCTSLHYHGPCLPSLHLLSEVTVNYLIHRFYNASHNLRIISGFRVHGGIWHYDLVNWSQNCLNIKPFSLRNDECLSIKYAFKSSSFKSWKSLTFHIHKSLRTLPSGQFDLTMTSLRPHIIVLVRSHRLPQYNINL